MGVIDEHFTLYVSQFAATENSDHVEFDFPFEADCSQEQFFSRLVWGEGNHRQFKYNWFSKPSDNFKIAKGLYFFLKHIFLIHSCR
jgi:hypothetical protein